MSQLERIGISLDKEILSRFDALIAGQGYPNRSEAIRDLIRRRLSEEELEKPTAQAIAGVFLVYDHHATGLSRKMLELQHHNLLQTVSSLHVHLDHENCLEIIVLKGRVKDISRVSDKLTSLKGVKLSRVNVLALGE
ncbi:nickel-responsive transcriptional regulator NikR [Planctomycetota bacterium]